MTKTFLSSGRRYAAYRLGHHNQPNWDGVDIETKGSVSVVSGSRNTLVALRGQWLAKDNLGNLSVYWDGYFQDNFKVTAK